MSLSRDIMDRLHVYLDGELPLAERKAFERELASDPDLKKAHDELKAIQDELEKVEPLPVDNTFEDRLMEKIHKPKRFVIRVNGTQAIAASIVLLLMFGTIFLERTSVEPETEVAQASMLDNLSSILTSGELSPEDVFNFAVHRQLPIDESGKVLELGTTDAGVEYFAIKPSGSRTSLDGFKDALKLSKEEAAELEILLSDYARDLQRDALLKREKTMAVNANLWAVNEALVAEVFDFAERTNKKSFYHTMPANMSMDYYNSLKKLKGSRRPVLTDTFIVLTASNGSTPIAVGCADKRQDSSRVRIKMIINKHEVVNGDSTHTHMEFDTTIESYDGKYIDSSFFHIKLPSNVRAMVRTAASNASFPDLDSTFEGYFNTARKHLQVIANPDSFWMSGDENFFFDLDEDVSFGFNTDDLNWDGDSGTKIKRYQFSVKGINSMNYPDSMFQTAVKEKAYMGIFIKSLDKIEADEMGIEHDGVYVDGVMEESGAEEAGLLKGDVITEVDKKPVYSPQELVKLMNDYMPGDKVNVSLYRDGKRKNIRVQLKSRKTYIMTQIKMPNMEIRVPRPAAAPRPSQPPKKDLDELRDMNIELQQELQRLREELELLKEDR